MRITIRVPVPMTSRGSSPKTDKMTTGKWIFLVIMLVIFSAFAYGVVKSASSIPYFNEDWEIVIYVSVIALFYLGLAKVTYET